MPASLSLPHPSPPERGGLSEQQPGPGRSAGRMGGPDAVEEEGLRGRTRRECFAFDFPWFSHVLWNSAIAGALACVTADHVVRLFAAKDLSRYGATHA